MALTVASYNIRKAVGLDRRRRPERILAVLNALGADVVLLQEADRRLGARPAALPREMIARETDYRVADLAPNAVSLGWHGNAVLVRDGLAVEEAERIALPGLEPRGAVLVRVAGLSVVGTHLGLIRRWRMLQMRAILAALGPRAERAVIGGDFNEWSRRTGFEPWSESFRIVSPGPSFHAARPLGRLDRFALGRAVRIEDSGVMHHGPARRASDHLPVWARIAD